MVCVPKALVMGLSFRMTSRKSLLCNCTNQMTKYHWPGFLRNARRWNHDLHWDWLSPVATHGLLLGFLILLESEVNDKDANRQTGTSRVFLQNSSISSPFMIKIG